MQSEHTPLFQLSQRASVVVSKALSKVSALPPATLILAMTDISNAKAPAKTVVKKTAFFRKIPLGQISIRSGAGFVGGSLEKAAGNARLRSYVSNALGYPRCLDHILRPPFWQYMLLSTGV